MISVRQMEDVLLIAGVLPDDGEGNYEAARRVCVELDRLERVERSIFDEELDAMRARTLARDLTS